MKVINMNTKELQELQEKIAKVHISESKKFEGPIDDPTVVCTTRYNGGATGCSGPKRLKDVTDNDIIISHPYPSK